MSTTPYTTTATDLPNSNQEYEMFICGLRNVLDRYVKDSTATWSGKQVSKGQSQRHTIVLDLAPSLMLPMGAISDLFCWT
jgi:hypothetical protein